MRSPAPIFYHLLTKSVPTFRKFPFHIDWIFFHTVRIKIKCFVLLSLYFKFWHIGALLAISGYWKVSELSSSPHFGVFISISSVCVFVCVCVYIFKFTMYCLAQVVFALPRTQGVFLGIPILLLNWWIKVDHGSRN